jgi:hypothetical protein
VAVTTTTPQAGGASYPLYSFGVAFSGTLYAGTTSGSYTESSVMPIRLHAAGTVKKIYLDATSACPSSGCTMVLRNQGVGNLSGISLSIPGGATTAEQSGSITLTGMESLIFSLLLGGGGTWSATFTLGFVFDSSL